MILRRWCASCGPLSFARHVKRGMLTGESILETEAGNHAWRLCNFVELCYITIDLLACDLKIEPSFFYITWAETDLPQAAPPDDILCRTTQGSHFSMDSVVCNFGISCNFEFIYFTAWIGTLARKCRV